MKVIETKNFRKAKVKQATFPKKKRTEKATLESKSKLLSKEQLELLDRIVECTYSMDKTNRVNVAGNAVTAGRDLDENPVQFGAVSGDFDCSDNKLKSLKGAPKIVGGNFDCSNNRLTSLEEAPRRVKGDFLCHNNSVQFTIEDVMKVTKVKGKIIT